MKIFLFTSMFSAAVNMIIFLFSLLTAWNEGHTSADIVFEKYNRQKRNEVKIKKRYKVYINLFHSYCRV